LRLLCIFAAIFFLALSLRLFVSFFAFFVLFRGYFGLSLRFLCLFAAIPKLFISANLRPSAVEVFSSRLFAIVIPATHPPTSEDTRLPPSHVPLPTLLPRSLLIGTHHVRSVAAVCR
jgi:hypothetical protein